MYYCIEIFFKNVCGFGNFHHGHAIVPRKMQHKFLLISSRDLRAHAHLNYLEMRIDLTMTDIRTCFFDLFRMYCDKVYKYLLTIFENLFYCTQFHQKKLALFFFKNYEKVRKYKKEVS